MKEQDHIPPKYAFPQNQDPSERLERALHSFKKTGSNYLKKHTPADDASRFNRDDSIKSPSIPASEDKLEKLCLCFSKYVPEGSGGTQSDRLFLGTLIDEFDSELDLEDQFMQFYAWSLDQPPTRKINFRSRFRSWLKNAVSYKERNN